MTITPTDPSAGVVAPAGDSGRAGDPATGRQFLAVIHKALTGASSTAKDAPDDATAKDPAAARGTDQPGDGSTSTPAGTDPTALGLVLPPGLASQLAAVTAAATPPSAAAGAATGPAGASTTTAAGHANVADGTTQPLTGPTGDIRMSGGAAPTTPPASPAVGAHPAAPADPQTSAASHRTAGPDAPGDTPAAAADQGQSAPAAQAPAAPAAVATQTAPTPGVPTAASVLPPGLTTVAPAADATATATPVTGQVFPEVTSLVSRGEGTHRITLTLKPEALGEVRVVMTVRDGAVHVRLAAGHEAQQALLEGSPELTRLLEHAGASDTRIVVRDLASLAPSSASADTGRNLGREPGQGLGSGAGPGTHGQSPQDQHAGTRAEHLATDGAHRSSTTTGATPPRSDEPATHTRRAGVDVAM